MKGLFIPDITTEMFRNGCLEGIEALMAEGEIYDIEYDPKSAEPERKRGKWEIYVISPFDGEGCRCPKCKYEGAPYWDFCPNCGADMRGKQK